MSAPSSQELASSQESAKMLMATPTASPSASPAKMFVATPIASPAKREATPLDSTCFRSAPDAPSPAKRRKTVDDVISGLETLAGNLDTNLRAALYSLSEGDRQQVKETLERMRRDSRCALQQSIFHLQEVSKMNTPIEQKIGTMQKYNSNLVMERNDYRRRLKLAQEENAQLKVEVEKIFSVGDPFLQEDQAETEEEQIDAISNEDKREDHTDKEK